jgi:hypothetical protein
MYDESMKWKAYQWKRRGQGEQRTGRADYDSRCQDEEIIGRAESSESRGQVENKGLNDLGTDKSKKRKSRG